MFETRQNRSGIIALLIGLLPAALLVLTGYTGTLSRYLADDFCDARWTHRLGLFRSIWYWYINWNGRFTAYASDWLVMLPGSSAFPLVLPIVLILWVGVTALAIFVLMQRARQDPSLWPAALISGVVIVATVLTIIPSMAQAFYWWSGMRLYTLPLAVLTLYVALFMMVEGRLGQRGMLVVLSLASGLLCLIAAGFSEVYAVLQLGLLCLLALASLLAGRRRWLWLLASGAAGTVLALVVMAASPGNGIREIQFPTHPSIAGTLAIAGQSFMTLLGGLFTSPEKALALVGIVTAAAWVGVLLRCPPRQRWLAPAILAAGLLLTFGTFLPTSWGLSEPPPARILTVPAFALVVTLIAAGYVAGSQLFFSWHAREAAAVLSVAAFIAVNLSALVTIGKFRGELPTYATFAQHWDEAHAQILQARAAGAKSVQVISWPNWASVNVLSDNPKNWLNQCETGLYGIEVTGREP